MRFTKAHGAGNDFVVIADLDDDLDLTPSLVRALCDRHRGVGADGVLRLGRPPADADVFMDYRNADGSVVEMCGNGVRVAAKHVADHGLIDVRGETVRVGTRAGVKVAVLGLGVDGKVASARVDMGPPEFHPHKVPFTAGDDDALVTTIDVDGSTVDLTAASMGNPHAVLLVDDVDVAPVRSLGPRLERDERFPQGANVEFVEVVTRDRVRLRVWERGVGETLACGTGICAAAAALTLRGLTDSPLTVVARGGELRVDYVPDDHPSVFLTGPAVEVLHGELDPAWLTEAAGAQATSDVSPHGEEPH